MGIRWGPKFGSGNSYGRLGVNITKTYTQTEAEVKIAIYYRSKYKVSDSENTFYYGWSKTADKKIGAKKINHKSDTAWDESNVTKIKEYTKNFKRTTKEESKPFSCKCKSIGNGGGNGEFVTSFKVQAKNQYKVNYNANGGSGAPAQLKYYYGETTVLSKSIPTKSGAKFLGWSTSKTAATASYKGGQSWNSTIAKDVTLYAVWKPVYTITFNCNGGTINGAGSYSSKVESGATLTSLPQPSKANAVFKGWNTKQDGSGTNHTSVKGTANLTLYAVWKPVYTITFNCNGGTINGAGSYAREMESGATLTSLPQPSKANAVFKGWNSKQDGSGTMFTSFKVMGNMILYAIYEEVESVSLVKVNGEFKHGELFCKKDKFLHGVAFVKKDGKWR